MSKDSLNLFLKALQESFLVGDWGTLVAYFTLPLVIYSDAGVVVLRREEQLVSMLRQYRTALGSTEVASTTLDVESHDAPYNKRLRATVRITDFAQDGEQVRHSLIRYFLLEVDDGYKVEMLEYIESSLPIAEVKRIIH